MLDLIQRVATRYLTTIDDIVEKYIAVLKDINRPGKHGRGSPPALEAKRVGDTVVVTANSFPAVGREGVTHAWDDVKEMDSMAVKGAWFQGGPSERIGYSEGKHWNFQTKVTGPWEITVTITPK